MNTTSTVSIKGPPKQPGWCQEQGIEHAWEAGPALTCNPPIRTRRCKNCGLNQYQEPERWCDAP